MKVLKNLLLSFSLIFTLQLTGQQILAVNDTLCINEGDQFTFDVTDNDLPIGTSFSVVQLASNTCFRITSKGDVLPIASQTSCCRTHEIPYEIRFGDSKSQGVLTIIVKCPKPNCSLVDLEEVDPAGTTNPPAGNKKIYYACQDNPITYFVSYNPTYNYTWMVGPSGTDSPGSNDAEIVVNWNTPGPSTLTLTIDNGNTTTTQVFCIEVLPAPIAAFTTTMNCVCNNSEIFFTNTSSGASTYLWDFGDGSTSTQIHGSHEYNTPGSYIVTLYAYSSNSDPQGNPLCCCVDSTQMTITVDPLSGPDILWISTLCAGDTSKYWTTATGCTYTWSVFDANNNPIIAPNFTGQGNDTICVIWGNGPHGYVTLQATGCPTVCNKPVTALVPIISTVENIDGETIVCTGSKETYTLPKWNGTTYNWSVTGGMVLPPNGGHEVTIMWGNGSSGSIHVDYVNPFLQGLPGHDSEDCIGHADLNVLIKPEYTINATPPTICVGDSINVFTSLPSPPTEFTWIIDPPQSGWPIVGSNNIYPKFNNVGFYTICVFPNNPNFFCNDTICFSIDVTTIAPPDSITGEKIICPDASESYTAHHSSNAVQFNWVVTGGTASSLIGNPINVDWGSTGPYSISVKATDLAQPNCMSTFIVCPITARVLLTPDSISSANDCINSVQSYSLIGPAQDPATTYTWSILNVPADGSVIAGQGTPNVNIQWNNTPGSATIQCVLKLCDDSIVVTKNVILHAPIIPVIGQIGVLCPSVNVILTASPGPFTSAIWTTGPGTPVNIVASTPGLYVVTTTDNNGCTAKASYTLDAVPGPYTTISTPNLETVCLPNPGYMIKYTVVSIPNVTYEWFCGATSQGPASATNTMFTHTVTAASVPGIFNYRVFIRDTITGCTGWSNIRQVVHTTCTGGCNGTPPAVTINSFSSAPLCNKFTFSYTSSGPITPLSWNFNDPYGVLNMPGPISPMFTFSDAGSFIVSFTFSFVDPVTGVTCQSTVYTSVSVPVAPNFRYEFTGACREVKFTDLSGVLLPAVISSLEWDWDDPASPANLIVPVTTSMVTHVYSNPGTYNVSLTVTTTTGCVVTKNITIVVNGVSTAGYSIVPSTVCVGENAVFTYLGTANDILTSLYVFGDGSDNGGLIANHAYLNPGNPIITSLTVTDIFNCSATTTQNIIVNPLPANDTITYSPSLKVCAGQTVTLTAPLQIGGYYDWNTGATSQSISVTTSGVYAVTVTNSFMCSRVLDSVEVNICPLPEANIAGSHFICGNDCITLQASLGFNYTYQWFDEFGNPIPGATFSTLDVCYPSGFQDSVFVKVTDDNGCTNLSFWWTIEHKTDPSLYIAMVPAVLCAGTPNLLTAVASPTTVSYLWSTGATSAAIIAIQEGSYTVFVTDTITGCSASATKIVNPIPDFCEMPTGCYEVCNPDTLCGPAGMASYQWNFNGVPITGANGQCLEVDMNGAYSLTAINSFGCPATSDTLILQMVFCCDTSDTQITASPISSTKDGCCVKLSYDINQDSLMGLFIYSNNADITMSPGTLDPQLSLIGNTASSLTLANSISGTPLPTGQLNGFIRICASNLVTSPAIVYFSWLGPDGQALCLDSILIECNPHECVYIESDSIICNPDDPSSYIYTVTVCNPITNDWNIRYIDLIELAPAGAIITPGALTTAPITPGNCATFSFVISGSNLVNQHFCYNLVAHEFNPVLNPAAKCCSIDTTQCVFMPGCTPCDSTYIKEITHGEDTCCFNLVLNNYHDDNTYFGIGVCALTTNSTLTLNNTLGSGWTTTSLLPNNFELGYNAGALPLGDIVLPEFCVSNDILAQNSIEIKWLGFNAGVLLPLCRDTFEAICDNGCGYFEIVNIICKEPNIYAVSIIFHNFSEDTVYSASLSFIPSTPGNNTTVVFPGGVLPNDTYGPFTIALGPTFAPNSVVCMVTNLHNSLPKEPSTTCCQFKTNIQLPDCDTGVKCECDPAFEKEAEKGVSCIVSGNTVVFTPLGNLTDCDQVIWDLLYNQTSFVTINNQSFTHTFPTKGEYEICITILRTTPDGKQCKVKIVKEVSIKSFLSFRLSPNPTTYEINVNVRTNDDESVLQKLAIISHEGKILKQVESYTDKDGNIKIPIEDIRAGLYFIRMESDGRFVYKKFIKIE